jgi:hypothetical protein
MDLFYSVVTEWIDYDCNLRTMRLIEKEVRLGLQEMYGSVFELALFKITHEEDQMHVLGEFVGRPGEMEPRLQILSSIPGLACV